MVDSTQGRNVFFASYLQSPGRSILGSSEGFHPRGYTFDHRSVAPDAYGRRVVLAGTTLQTYSTTPHCSPRTGTNNAIGVLLADLDCTLGDEDIAMVVQGVVREDLCWDAGAYNGVDATHVKAALPFIRWVTVDD